MGFRVAIVFKIFLIFFLFFQNISVIAWEYETLSGWTEECLENLPEGPTEHKTVLSKDEFKKAIKSLVDAFATAKDFVDPQKWVGENKPDEKLFRLSENEKSWKGFLYSEDTFEKNEKACAYVQKLVVAPKSKICFMGDIHGALHSLLRNLWRLLVKGYLKDNFELKDKKKIYMVFFGDYVDRGIYGSEVWYTLARLKLANWDNVILIRGNHEEISICRSYGFFEELKKKYNNGKEACNVFRYLPLALFLGSGKKEGKKSFAQCCHGGINQRYIFNDLRKLNKNTKTGFEKIEDWAKDFSWSDFDYEDDITLDEGGSVRASGRGEGALCGRNQTTEYLEDNNIKAFFRGHQHHFYGLKMLSENKSHWKEIVPKNERKNNECAKQS